MWVDGVCTVWVASGVEEEPVSQQMDQLQESGEVLYLQDGVEEETNEHLHSTKNRDVENRLKTLKSMRRRNYRTAKAPLLKVQLKKKGGELE